MTDERMIPAPSSGNFHARTARRYTTATSRKQRSQSAERLTTTTTSTAAASSSPFHNLNRRRFMTPTTTLMRARNGSGNGSIRTTTKLGMFLFGLVICYMGLVLYLAPKAATTTLTTRSTLSNRQQSAQSTMKQPAQPKEEEYQADMPLSLPSNAGKVFRQQINAAAAELQKQQEIQSLDQLLPDSEQMNPDAATVVESQHAHAANYIDPQNLFQNTADDIRAAAPLQTDLSNPNAQHPSPHRILTAYHEPVDYDVWFNTQPLPNRTTATAEQLSMRQFSRVNSCRHLMQQWPVDAAHDCPTDVDPYLPWIHDVIASADGRHVHFVAQNKRRCDTGKHDAAQLQFRQGQVALFQHVPIKRVYQDNNDNNKNETRYQLTNHADADPDAVATRFICQFSNGDEVPSVFHFDYDWTSFRKRYKGTFFANDGGIKSIHTSQLIFSCPLPAAWHATVRTGQHVHNDWTKYFVNLIPIRTPPRYGVSTQFLQPRYAANLEKNVTLRFDPVRAWGTSHVLPRLQDSGRWENIPICLPSLLQYERKEEKEEEEEEESNHHDKADEWISQELDEDKKANTTPDPLDVHNQVPAPVKKHRIVSCLWASAGYRTRGERFAINDGQRRLLEWITYHQDVLGFDHVYLYDNSGAFSNETSLKPVADLFPDTVTYIAWPSQICNNRPNNVDSPGERSSQYAAESSCRLRFGPHVDWIGQFDVDEYLVPMGEYGGIHALLDKWEVEDSRILSFASWRSWPRWSMINPIHRLEGRDLCHDKRPCFDLSVPAQHSILQTYNCDRFLPGRKGKVMPAEKQIYQPSYVYQHFVHYSAVTALSVLNQTEYEAQGYRYPVRAFPDKRQRFGSETTEALMIHTKAIARQDTAGWEQWCTVENLSRPKNQRGLCRLGIPWPEPWPEDPDTAEVKGTSEGWAYNCFVNPKVEKELAPRLQAALQARAPMLGPQKTVSEA